MKSVALAIEERSPRGIATGIARMITTGDLAPGDRLPTVRDLAVDLGVSPATVFTPDPWRMAYTCVNSAPNSRISDE